MIEQIRFIEARDLVAEALADIGPPEDALVGRLLALHAWAKVAQGDRDGTVEGGRARAGARARRRSAARGRGAGATAHRFAPRTSSASRRSGPRSSSMALAQEMWGVALRARSMRAGNDPNATSGRGSGGCPLDGGARDHARPHRTGLHGPCSGRRVPVRAGRVGRGAGGGIRGHRHRRAQRVFPADPTAPGWPWCRSSKRAGIAMGWLDSRAGSTPSGPPSRSRRPPMDRSQNSAMDRALAAVGLPPVWRRPITVETLARETIQQLRLHRRPGDHRPRMDREGECRAGGRGASRRSSRTARAAGRDAADSRSWKPRSR